MCGLLQYPILIFFAFSVSVSTFVLTLLPGQEKIYYVAVTAYDGNGADEGVIFLHTDSTGQTYRAFARLFDCPHIKILYNYILSQLFL